MAGEPATEAVKKAVVVLEDCPWFNAGKGAVFTPTGKHDLDAGIMDGRTGTVGGVTYIHHLKNPIIGAECVRVHTRHSLLAGRGAEDFCVSFGANTVAPEFFDTDYRRQQLAKVLAASGSGAVVPALDHDVEVAAKTETVGAVALDSHGNLATASSTGGQTGKLDGRISDSSIAGAGFYANQDVAISGTGDGDYFLNRSMCAIFGERYRAAPDSEKSPDRAGRLLVSVGEDIIHEYMKGAGAGAIILDRYGNVAMPFNTVGMFRGFLKATAMTKPFVAICKDDNAAEDLEIFG